ncbi:MAG: nucleoside triphosphate pyrophosphohydrolase [Patescibacteria group bacterium]
MKYDKLVRDKIPDVIRAEGRTPTVSIADEAEYWTRLKDKLREEVEELCHDENEGEVADVLEVLDAIIAYKKFDRVKIGEIKQKKNQERGGFGGRVILVEAD